MIQYVRLITEPGYTIDYGTCVAWFIQDGVQYPYDLTEFSGLMTEEECDNAVQFVINNLDLGEYVSHEWTYVESETIGATYWNPTGAEYIHDGLEATNDNPASNPGSYYDYLPDTPGGQNQIGHSSQWQHQPWITGIRFYSEDHEIYIGFDDDFPLEYLKVNSEGRTIADWILYNDAFMENQGLDYVDSQVTLRKLMWGRRVTPSEQQEETIPLGSYLYGLYPAMRQIPKGMYLDHYSSDGGPNANWWANYYNLTTDATWCWNSGDPWNPLLTFAEPGSPPEEFIEAEDYLENIGNLQRMNLSDFPVGSFASIGNYRQIYHKSFGYNAGSRIKDYNVPDSELPYQINQIEVGGNLVDLRLLNQGTDAVWGSDNWVVIDNINGVKTRYKLDATFNSTDTTDIIIGGINTRTKGNVEIDFWREDSGSYEDSGVHAHFYMETDCFEPTSGHEGDDTFQKAHLLLQPNAQHYGTNPTTADEEGEPASFYKWSTGDYALNDDAEWQTGISYYGTGTVDTDSDNPTYYNDVCNAGDNGNWQDNPNAVNNYALNFHIGHPTHSPDWVVKGNFRTRISGIELNQQAIIENLSGQKYYGHVMGRIDDAMTSDTGILGIYQSSPTSPYHEYDSLEPDAGWILNNPVDILHHIVAKEFGYTDSVDISSKSDSKAIHDGWEFNFALDEEMDAKDFIKDFSKNTRFIPRFKNTGTDDFTYVSLKKEYGDNDVDYTIKSKDIISFQYSKTPINDVKLMVKVSYDYDAGLKKYQKHTNGSRDGAVPLNWEEYLDHYNIDRLEDAYLEFKSRYINDEATAKKLQYHLLSWHQHQHNIITCKLPIQYLHLEAGDIVNFDSLIKDMELFGNDYTEVQYYNLGQNLTKVYPYFMVEEVSVSDDVSLKLVQMIEQADFYILPEREDFLTEIAEEDVIIGDQEEEETNVVLGDVNQDGAVDVLDVIVIVQHILGNTQLDFYSAQNADMNNDNYVDILDILTIITIIINQESGNI